jgi:phosphoglycolate phosphatase-like HAD superfamily hydrolase
MIKNSYLATAIITLPLAFGGVASAQPAAKKPNIVMIMADDVGIWNVSAYHRGMMGGSTPNIDRIAKEGALFTDYYAQQSCTLPSWNDTAAKKAIMAFVERVTKQGSPDFVPPAERIATFDNDGTLWAEQPIYFQLAFALDRVKALAPRHPEWKDKEPFASLFKGDLKGALAGGEAAIFEIVTVTHSGMTTEEFEKIVRDWIATAKHPKTGKLYTEMVYQPMLELLAYLRANGFTTFIVSGGGIDFMRVFAERVYGIPREQIVGSSGKLDFELRDGKPVLMKLPELNFNDDKGGKPVGIQMHIGRRPIFAFGNSDGDLQMLQWTTATTPTPSASGPMTAPPRSAASTRVSTRQKPTTGSSQA